MGLTGSPQRHAAGFVEAALAVFPFSLVELADLAGGVQLHVREHLDPEHDLLGSGGEGGRDGPGAHLDVVAADDYGAPVWAEGGCDRPASLGGSGLLRESGQRDKSLIR